MTDNIHEKLAPTSMLDIDGSVDIYYDLQSSTAGMKGQMYYRVAREGVFLWLDPDRQKIGVSLKIGTQLLAKANSPPAMLYVVVMSGEFKLDQGYVWLPDLDNKPAGPLPTIVAKNVIQGKADLEHLGVGWLYPSYKLRNKPLKIPGTTAGKIPAGTLMRYHGKRQKRKSVKYPKVEILNGPGTGLVGVVNRKSTTPFKTVGNQADVAVQIPFREAIQKLNDFFAAQRIKSMAGLEWLSLKDPTFIPSVFKGMKKWADIDPPLYLDKTIAFYNVADDTIDILQPYYFTQVKYVDPDMLNTFKTMFHEVEWACQALAYEKAEDDAAQKAVEAESTDSWDDTTIEQLGMRIINGTDQWGGNSVISRVAKNAARFFEVNPEIFERWFSMHFEKTIVTHNPMLSNSPRWGYWTFKIKIADLIKEVPGILFGNLLTALAANFLTDLTQGTTVGTALMHGYLAKFPRLKENTAQISIGVSSLEDRLDSLAALATNYKYDLAKANKVLWRAGATGLESQRPISQQIQNLRNFPALIKSSLVKGPLTAENVESLAVMAVRLNIKKGVDVSLQELDPNTGKPTDKKKITNDLLGLSSIVLENTFLRESTAVRSPTINTVNEKKENETIVLSHGKVAAIEKRFVDEIDKELAKIDFYDLAAEVKKIEDVLKAQKPDELPRAPDEYVFKKNGMRGYLVYMFADIVRQGTKDRRFDFEEGIPPGLMQNVLIKGKLVNIEDYSQLTKYTVGYIKSKDQAKPAFYVPDFPYLLKQIRWLNITEGETHTQATVKKTMTAKIDYNFLQIKMFMVDSHQVLKNFTPPEYSFLMALNKRTFTLLSDAENYKDFFDQLYTYIVHYKPPAAPLKFDPAPPVPDPRLLDPLTSAEKDKIMEELFHRRDEIVEQAFGGSGCIEFALKSVRSMEDLYSNVMNKANWALFIAQLIDRFKCELSKLGGGSLACLADFDVMGTFQSTLDAKNTILNFDDFLEKELQKQPTFPIMKIIYNRKVPTLPSIDWYKCLRGFLIGLLIKLYTDLIIAFVQMILALLDIQCGADFSSCERSERDSDSCDLETELDHTRGDMTAAGVTQQDAIALAASVTTFLRNADIDATITAETIRDFLHFLGENLSVAHFKSLLKEDTPVHIFSHGKLLANNFFAPIKFSDEQFRAVLNILHSRYSYDALIAAKLLESVLPDPNCPPDTYNAGEDIVDAIRDALKERIKAQTGLDDAAATKQAENDLGECKKEVEEKISAFCKVLNFAGGTLNEINSAPSLIAGIANAGIAGTVSQLVTQLRIKPFYDYSVLRYLFIGDLFSDNPTKDDLIRAEMSLAYNVVYRNYWLTQVDHRSYYKNYKLQPEGFRNNLGDRWGRANKILKVDSFEREFMQDIILLLPILNPFILPMLPYIEAAIFDVQKPLNGFEKTLLGASRDLNNSNYFYAWAENLLSLIPIIDPRRFGTKYKDFVKENYPNAKDGKLLESAFVLKTTFDDAGLNYVYTNKDPKTGVGVTLLDMRIGLKDFTVMINDEKTQYSRDLPKLSEPFFVDEAQNYLDIVETYDKINTTTETVNPQKRIYNALAEQGLEQGGFYSGTGAEGTLRMMIAETFNNSYGRINTELNKNLENADEQVAKFFFKPYMEADKRFGGMGEDLAKKTFEGLKSYDDVLGLLSNFGNPRAPVVLFFQRSDNIFSEVFFEDSVSNEVEKVMDKVGAAFQNFYHDLSDGKPYDPNAISKALDIASTEPEAFYEVQKLASSKQPDWLSRSQKVWDKHVQKRILEAVKEVTS